MMLVCCLLGLLATAPTRDPIQIAKDALADFRAEDALVVLAAAKAEGGLDYTRHVELYAQLGIAHAYIEQSAAAIDDFRRMLALDPTGALSYTLSPKVTFLFEEARRQAQLRPRPSIDVTWTQGPQVDQPVIFEVAVLADPLAMLRRARLYTRLAGESTFRERSFPLPSVGSVERLSFSAFVPDARRAQRLEVYLVAEDASRNEVLLWQSANQPREIALAYEPGTPWYGRWWLWTAVGVAVAAGSSAAVWAATREPSPTATGRFVLE